MISSYLELVPNSFLTKKDNCRGSFFYFFYFFLIRERDFFCDQGENNKLQLKRIKIPSMSDHRVAACLYIINNII